jgi:hypothetical protein
LRTSSKGPMARNCELGDHVAVHNPPADALNSASTSPAGGYVHCVNPVAMIHPAVTFPLVPGHGQLIVVRSVKRSGLTLTHCRWLQSSPSSFLAAPEGTKHDLSSERVIRGKRDRRVPNSDCAYNLYPGFSSDRWIPGLCQNTL